ncbi:MAG: GerAB/ArcD/ProY family transporter [Bacillota bacterium]
MNKENISTKQSISLIVMFIIGTSSIIVTGLEAKKDLWLATILAILMAMIMTFIYCGIHRRFPNKDLYDVLEICFGKIIGKGIGLLYVWFSLHLASLIIRDFSEFYIVTVGYETHMIIILAFVSVLCIWGVKQGLEVLGRFSQAFVVLSIIMIYIAVLLLIPQMNLMNIRPFLAEGIKPVLKGTFSAFGFPFGEVVIFLMVFSHFKQKNGCYKIYIQGLIISGAVILTTALTDVLILGVNTAASIYFPTYAAVSRMDIGHFLQRLEITVSFVYLIGGVVKATVCLLAASKGVAKVLKFKEYRFIVTPMGLIMLNLSYLMYESIMEFLEWSMTIWPYYAFVFQVIIPVIVFITAIAKSSKVLNKTA